MIALWAFVKSWKGIVCGVAILAIFLGFRWWLVSHDDRVYQQGKVAATAEIEKAKKAEWATKETAIAADAAKVATDKRSLETDRARLAQERINLSKTLKDGLAAIQGAKERDYAQVATVPADELDSALRALSAELATTH